MVSGNGTHGAMVFGDPLAETIVVNHERLFLPREEPGDPLEVAADLPVLRQILARDGYAAGLVYLDTQAATAGRRPARGSRSFHPACSLAVTTVANGLLADYRRETDFRTGEVRVRFQADGHPYDRRLFVSRPAACIVLELRTDHPAHYELAIGNLGTPNVVRSTVTPSTAGLALRHAYVHGKAGYDTAVCIAATDGAVTFTADRLAIRDSRRTLLLVRVEPWQSVADSHPSRLLERLRELAEPYDAMLCAHAARHTELYDRVTVDFRADDAERQLDIDALLALAESRGTLPIALLEKLYHAGRYMTICSSGTLPPNLQGIWTGTWDTPWGSGYVWDTNLQLAIASTLSCNLGELYQAYANLVQEVLPFWRDNAVRVYGGPGLYATGGHAAGIDADGTHRQTYGHWCWLFEAGYAGWAARLLYDYYLYTGDTAFLRERCLPMLLELAAFYRTWLILDETGHYRFSPGCSPESALGDNPTFEIAVARDVFTMLSDTASVLAPQDLVASGVTPEAIADWSEMRRRLPPYLVNNPATTAGPPDHRPYFVDNVKCPLAPDGALKEFAAPNYPEVYSHRHFSHLYPLFVSGELDPESTPELWQAARIALDQRLGHWLHAPEQGQATHQRMQGALCALRFGLGDVAWKILTIVATRGALYPSLMMSHYDAHSVFNVDGNGALPDIVNRMLVEARTHALTLLPALPGALPQGRVGGIRVKRRILVERLEWDTAAGWLVVNLLSEVDQELTLALGEQYRLVGIDAHPGMDGGSLPVAGSTVNLRAGECLHLEVSYELKATHGTP